MYKISKVGTTIAELRIENGLKQNKLSDMLSMSPGNLSNYENGVYWPSLDTLCQIADLFNVTTDYILGRTGYRCPPETFEKYINPDYKVQQIINLLLSLDDSSVDSLIQYARYLKWTKGKKEKKQQPQVSHRAEAPREKKEQPVQSR